MPILPSAMDGSTGPFQIKNWMIFVDRFARRIASFDKKVLTEAKRLVNRSSPMPDDARLVAAEETFTRMLSWPETRARIAELIERGLQKPGDFELRLGKHLGNE
jgi:hypothetical protein